MKTLAFDVELCGRRLKMRIFDDAHCRKSTADVLADKSYPPIKGVVPKKIVDLGGCFGAAACLFGARYPKAEITVYEPDPDIFTLLKENTAWMGDRCRCVEAAVAMDGAAMVTFNRDVSPVMSSLCERPGTCAESFSVKAVSPSEAIPIGTDLVKIDVEGLEAGVILFARAALQLAQVVYIEYHNATARLFIDPMLGLTHDLAYARVLSRRVGELAYIHREVKE